MYQLFTPHHFLFLDNIEKIKKNLSKFLNTFEYIIEFHNILKSVVFQRRQKELKELLWRKGLCIIDQWNFPSNLIKQNSDGSLGN